MDVGTHHQHPLLPRTQVTAEFDQIWGQFAVERHNILDDGRAREHERLVTTLNNTIHILKYSPYRHMQKVVVLSKALFTPLYKPGYYVYRPNFKKAKPY